jgi:hypothetical protein
MFFVCTYMHAQSAACMHETAQRRCKVECTDMPMRCIHAHAGILKSMRVDKCIHAPDCLQRPFRKVSFKRYLANDISRGD